MLEWITQINNAVNGVVWGPAGLALLFGTGLIMSVRTGFFQFRKMGYWLRHTIGAIFTNKDVTAHTSKEDMAISQFQSMCTALAGTIGTGNIVGVATAIVSGGPGAIFWMWVMALLGMMTSFSENVLGVYYRRKNEKGEWSGGAMYYLTDGLGAKKGCKQLGKVLAVLFACFCILASFGIGNMSQLNSIAGNMNAAFGVPTIVTGLALMVVTALIVIGGLKRVAAVTEKLVPLMALFYIAGALIIVVMHAGNIPASFGAIFKGAFNLQAAGGGALGYGISQTITWGFKRGAFSNEAGLGSAVMVNSASNVKEPVHQGMWGVFEVFADTIVGVHPHRPGHPDHRRGGPAERCGAGQRAGQRLGGAGLHRCLWQLWPQVHRHFHPAVCLLHHAGLEPLWHESGGVPVRHHGQPHL